MLSYVTIVRKKLDTPTPDVVRAGTRQTPLEIFELFWNSFSRNKKFWNFFETGFYARLRNQSRSLGDMR
jgi:hypothetical protein